MRALVRIGRNLLTSVQRPFVYIYIYAHRYAVSVVPEVARLIIIELGLVWRGSKTFRTRTVRALELGRRPPACLAAYWR